MLERWHPGAALRHGMTAGLLFGTFSAIAVIVSGRGDGRWPAALLTWVLGGVLFGAIFGRWIAYRIQDERDAVGADPSDYRAASRSLRRKVAALTSSADA